MMSVSAVGWGSCRKQGRQLVLTGDIEMDHISSSIGACVQPPQLSWRDGLAKTE